MAALETRVVLELDNVYEQWITHTRSRKCVPYKEHSSMSSQPGWWVSGWRGVGPEMKPLPPEVATYFERDHR